MLRRALVVGVTALVAAGAAAAATAPLQLVESGGARFPFRSYVLTLPKAQALPLAHLHVTENGVPVRALSVISAQKAQESQFSVVLAIDASDSMQGKPIVAAMQAARAFAAHRNPNQQLAIVTFNSGVHVLQPLTTNANAIRASLARAPKLNYGTRLYDALSRSADLLAAAHAHSASIILLSDGADVGSAAQRENVLRRAAGEHARVFTVGLASRAFDPKALQEISARTKASYTEAASPSALRPIFDALGYQLSREYLVSYQSLAGPGVRVHVRAHVDGFPGIVPSEYVTPTLKIQPAAPYRPSTAGRIIQSSLAMVVVALLAAGIIGWALLLASRPQQGTLVGRVARFVSVTRRAKEGEEVTHRRVDLLRGAEGALERLRWWPRFKATLELADIQASATQIVLLTLLGTVVAMLAFYTLLGGAGILLGFFGPLVARGLVQTKLTRKRRAFAEQLPDNLEVLSAALRAGHSLVGALSAVVESAPEPSYSEFRRVIAEEQLGVPLEEALGTVVERMDNRDLDQVALVARLQRETGSSAAEVIDRVIETVRSRADLRRLVRTLTTQGRLSRWILTGLPIALALILPLLNPGYLDPLLHRSAGQVLLVFTAIFVISGSLVIGKIVNIKV